MNIQIVSHNKSVIVGDGYDITYSTINRPQSFDAFDINIISLQDEDLWECDKSQFYSINSINDFDSIHEMILASKKAKIIVFLPMNYYCKYNWYSSVKQYGDSIEIKDCLPQVNKIINHLIPNTCAFNLRYDISKSVCAGKQYDADFVFTNYSNKATICSTSIGGNYPTTLQFNNRITITTLLLFQSTNDLKNFLTTTGHDCSTHEYPQWLFELEFHDDKIQNNVITERKTQIDALQADIVAAQHTLNINMRYKSLLVSSGDDLVQVVFDILEKLLNCNLSDFVDEKKEDFRIKLQDITYVGEIKGITSNVKSENVSQLDVHVQTYVDLLESEGRNENVKGLLIINPFRNKPIEQREPVHENQIKLANRNNSLIITSDVLLMLFEHYLQAKITTVQITKLFTTKTGLLQISDIASAETSE